MEETSIAFPVVFSVLGLASIFIISNVVLRGIQKRSVQKRTASEFFRDLFTILLTLLVIIPLTFVTAILAFAQHVYNNWHVYLGLTAAVGAAELMSRYHKPMMETYDHLNTKHWMPFYNDVIVRGANYVRAGYNVVICWTNLLFQVENIAIQEALKILVHCIAISATDIAHAVVDLAESPYFSILKFVSGKGQDRFDFLTVFRAGGTLAERIADIPRCWCEDSSFIWNFLSATTFNNDNRFIALDALLNVPIDILREIANFLYELFTNLPVPFTCPILPLPVRIQCEVNRPPKFYRAWDDLTLAIKAWAFTFDDTLRAVLDIFFDYTNVFSTDTVPGFGFYMAAYFNWGVRVVEQVVDIVVHIDLVFTENYLKYANLTKPLEEIYCVSTGFKDAFDRLANGTGVEDFRHMGLGLAQLNNATLEVFNFTIRFVQRAFTGPNEIPEFGKTYPYKALIIDNWINGANNVTVFFKHINEPLGDTSFYFFQSIQDAFYILYLLAFNVDTIVVGSISQINTFRTDFFDPAITRYRMDSELFAVSSGNVWRQIGQFYPSDTCPPINLTAWIANFDNPAAQKLLFSTATDKEIFCCLGDLIHSFFWLLGEGFTRIIVTVDTVLSIRDLSFSFSAFLADLADRFTFAVNRIDEIYDELGCTIASPLNYAQCPNIPADTVGFYIRLPITIYFNLTTEWAIRGMHIFVQAVSMTFNGASAADVICYLTTSTYDMTAGIFAQLIYSVQRLMACLVPGVPVVSGIWDLFGWDGSGSSLTNIRDQLCDVIQRIFRIFEFLVNILINVGGFFDEAIDFIESIFVDGIETAFNSIAVILGNIINVFLQGVIDLVDDLRLDVTNALNALINFINVNFVVRINRLRCYFVAVFPHLANCINQQTAISVNIPDVSFDIDIDVGIIHYNQNVHIPLPTITFNVFAFAAAFTCINNIGANLAASCGALTNVPTIPPVSLRRRGDIDPELYALLRQRQEDFVDHTARSSRAEKRDDYLFGGMYYHRVNELWESTKLYESKRAREGDPNGLVFVHGWDESMASRQERLVDPEYGLDTSNVTTDNTLIQPDSPCYPLAMIVSGGIITADNETGAIRMGVNNQTIDEILIQQSFENIQANDTMMWVRIHFIRELKWCLLSTQIVRGLNEFLQLDNDTSLPIDAIYDPTSAFGAVGNMLWRAYHIIHFQSTKGNVTTLDVWGNGTLQYYDDEYALPPGELNITQDVAWMQYIEANNITDKLLIKWGSFIDSIRIIADLYGVGKAREFAADVTGILGFLKTAFLDIWYVNIPGLAESRRAMAAFAHPDNGHLREPVWNIVKETWERAYGFGWINTQMQNQINRVKESILQAMHNMAITDNPRVIRNRYFLILASRRIRESVLLNVGSRPDLILGGKPAWQWVQDWTHYEQYLGYQILNFSLADSTTASRREQLETYLAGKAREVEAFKINRHAEIPNMIRNYAVLPAIDERTGCSRDTSFCSNSSLNLDYCAGGVCLNCLFLENYIDRMIFEICECLTASIHIVDDTFNYKPSLGKWGGSPENYPLPSTYNRLGEVFGNGTNTFILPNGTYIQLAREIGSQEGETTAYYNAVMETAPTVPLVPDPFNLNELIVNLALYVPRTFIHFIDWEGLGQKIVRFFTSEDFRSGDSAYNIISRTLLCTGRNYKCESRNSQLAGHFIDTLIVVYTSLIIFSIVGPRIFPFFGTIMPYLFLASFALVMLIHYQWTATCALTLPTCMADDIFDTVQYFGVECTPWFRTLPGLTHGQCPTSETDFRRPFIDCRKPPYNFKDGFRNFFTTLEIYWPGFNRYMRESNSLIPSLVRKIDHLREAMTFPFPPGQVPDDFKSCNKVTTGNWAAFLTLMALAFVAAGLMTVGIILALQTLWALILLLADGALDAGSALNDPAGGSSSSSSTGSPILNVSKQNATVEYAQGSFHRESTYKESYLRKRKNNRH